MAIDFSKCEICTPKGLRERVTYKALWEMFPYDRPVYNYMLNEGKRLYTMTNYALFQVDKFIGNVGLYPVSIWFEGRPLEIIGLGAVATVPKYRKKGVMDYLMSHCTNLIDQRCKPSVLYTELPAVYEKYGYMTVNQHYWSLRANRMEFAKGSFTHRYFETINRDELKKMQSIYDEQYPNLNGKVIRTEEPDYMQYYEMMFNPYMKPRLVWCLSGCDFHGYLRFEVEKDRLTVTELCTGSNDLDVIESLLYFVADFASLIGLEITTFALSADHMIWQILKTKGLHMEPEPEGVRREVFMVRPTAGESLGKLNNLQWSLADKF